MTALGTSSDLLTMAEVAARLHVSESQLRKIVKAGSIPFVNIGLGERPAYRFRPCDLAAFESTRLGTCVKKSEGSGAERATRRAAE